MCMEKTKITVIEYNLNADKLEKILQWCQGTEEYHICQYLDAKEKHDDAYLEGYHCGRADGICYVLGYLERAGIIKREAADENK